MSAPNLQQFVSEKKWVAKFYHLCLCRFFSSSIHGILLHFSLQRHWCTFTKVCSIFRFSLTNLYYISFGRWNTPLSETRFSTWGSHSDIASWSRVLQGISRWGSLLLFTNVCVVVNLALCCRKKRQFDSEKTSIADFYADWFGMHCLPFVFYFVADVCAPIWADHQRNPNRNDMLGVNLLYFRVHSLCQVTISYITNYVSKNVTGFYPNAF